RDHGGILFLDMRDSEGVLQVTSHDDQMFASLNKESVVQVKGVIRKRDEDDYNDKIKTGTVELVAEELTVLSKCEHVLPFEIKTSHNVADDIRLKYRYLDLRNPKMHNIVGLRSELLHFIRNKMYDMGFTEVQTPILTTSSPEGARDFVVPSRNFHGKFYALPQAPQIYKQLLMVSGIDKYFQIAPCFRDEDPRADRTLEFYQLDIEVSFPEIEQLYELGEDIYTDIFSKFSNKKIVSKKFPIIPYRESMLKYGTDKPDLRNPLIIIDLTEEFKDTSFKPFRNTTVRGIKVDNLEDKTNSWYNDIVDYATSIGMPGIGYINVQDDMSFKGPIDKFLTDEEREALIKKADLKKGSALFFIADKKNYNRYASLIRTYLGRKLELIDDGCYSFCIINDFPMFEYDSDNDKIDFGHNPFSKPKAKIEEITKENYENILANQFDIVCNGEEMASGALRNTDLAVLFKCFELVGYDRETVKEKFKSITTAFEYGVPPHGGFAPGVDRILMMLLDENNLREVQTFPPAASGQDLLMGGPTELTEQQLREIHVKIR
ncbi:MAG: aspartate--tRNA ligase, partial [Bacilli bacterium]|nr:aspartate--tRNA ligase [Bacilli bacterium]